MFRGILHGPLWTILSGLLDIHDDLDSTMWTIKMIKSDIQRHQQSGSPVFLTRCRNNKVNF